MNKNSKIVSCLRKYKDLINEKKLLFIGIESLTNSIVNELIYIKNIKINNIKKLENNIRGIILAGCQPPPTKVGGLRRPASQAGSARQNG